MDISVYISEKIRREREEWKPGHLKPSSLRQCDRRAILETMTPPTDPYPVDTLLSFAMGILIEGWVMEKIADLVVARQVEVIHAGWKGIIDAIISMDGSFHLLEIKSTSSGLSWNGIPYESHVAQVLAYQEMLGGVWDGKELMSPILLYVHKGTLRMAQYEIYRDVGGYPLVTSPDGNIVRRLDFLVTEEMERLSGFLENQVIPPIPFQSPTEHPYLCTYRGSPRCPYYSLCWGHQPAEGYINGEDEYHHSWR
jgi:hypothetical protein